MLSSNKGSRSLGSWQAWQPLIANRLSPLIRGTHADSWSAPAVCEEHPKFSVSCHSVGLQCLTPCTTVTITCSWGPPRAAGRPSVRSSPSCGCCCRTLKGAVSTLPPWRHWQSRYETWHFVTCESSQSCFMYASRSGFAKAWDLQGHSGQDCWLFPRHCLSL